MPAVSVSQQRLFGLAEHHPEKLHAENRGLASLSHQTLHDFAATPTKGLPSRKYYADGQLSDAFDSNKGGLHRATGTPENQPIPVGKVKAAAHSKDSHLHHMAQAAINMNPRHYYASK